jgi:hypothetical protein
MKILRILKSAALVAAIISSLLFVAGCTQPTSSLPRACATGVTSELLTELGCPAGVYLDSVTGTLDIFQQNGEKSNLDGAEFVSWLFDTNNGVRIAKVDVGTLTDSPVWETNGETTLLSGEVIAFAGPQGSKEVIMIAWNGVLWQLSDNAAGEIELPLEFEPVTEEKVEPVTEPITESATEQPTKVESTPEPITTVETEAETTTEQATKAPEPIATAAPVVVESPGLNPDFTTAMQYLIDGQWYGAITREERIGVLQALINKAAADNDCQPYALTVIPDSEMPKSWIAYADSATKTIVIRESGLTASVKAFNRWDLVQTIIHEATHMVHHWYIFSNVGNGAFLADTKLYGDDPTEALENIRIGLTTETAPVLDAAGDREHKAKMSEWTADMTGYRFLERYMPSGIARINVNTRKLEKIN